MFIDWLLGLVLFVLLSAGGCLVGRFAVGNLALMFRVIILGSCVGFAVVWVLCGAGLLRVFGLCFGVAVFCWVLGFRVLFSLVGSCFSVYAACLAFLLVSGFVMVCV